ncbi:MAG: hypothetical protein H6815_09990 [Phycisphaeraceae bacterium]|nr:hypothetical protein [Phycisphaerales bacterium]MCB9860768.1 hypothetical protein [Phycisphaeraceae bacterium]
MRTSTIACIAGSLIAATAFAGPDTTPNANPGKFVQTNNPHTNVGIDAVLTQDDFESYALGGGIQGANGWQGWFSTGADHTVTNAQASSGAQSIQYGTASGDCVQDYQNVLGNMPTSGMVTFSCMSYVASSSAGTGYTILLNNYGQATANCDWSWQISFEGLIGLVGNNLNANPNFLSQPIVYDQWVEIRCEIDLDNNSYMDFYNNTPLATAPTGWFGNGNLFSGGGAIGGVQVACLDMYSDAATDIFMDDVLVETDGAAPCYADCDGSGALNIFDYICFGNEYAAGNAYADCDGSGSLNIFDYICFGNEYAAGCP